MGELAIGIVAHMSRQEAVASLRQKVRPDLVEVDDGDLGVGGNHLLTLRQLQPIARRNWSEWVVALEDDALPVEATFQHPYADFRHYADGALDHAPSPLVSFYLGTGHPTQYQARCAELVKSEASWIRHTHMRHAVAYAIHTSVLSALIDQMTPLVRDKWAPDDAISAFALRNAYDVAYVNPSLVDHDDKLPPAISARTFRGRITHSRKYPRHAHKFGPRGSYDDTCVTL